ncbi:MAG TPA: hypothetical protein VHO24_00520 [Opitutaceae bacterium]|nr:hypothetical protein [Opitutaceae bacterium]
MKNTTINPHGRGVQAFVARHEADVTGVISGWDRLRLQGTLRSLYQPELMGMYLSRAGVWLKGFKQHVTAVSERIREAATTLAAAAGRPVHYLRGPLRKEEFVADIRRRDGIDEGLIAVLSAVEPCHHTWFVRGERASGKLELRLEQGKCIHLYFYFVHPQLGLMHLRLQTWFPFLIQVCCNGREWLARQLTAAGIAFRREDNALPWIADVPAAQALLDRQVRQHWPSVLAPLVAQYHPTFAALQQPMRLEYYWTVAESEYATDVMFRDRAALQKIYPALVHHSMTSFGAEQVLRFLGREKVGSAVDVKTTLRRREEGVCVKHWLNRNSQKLYDKGSIARCEGTMNEPADFRVWRAAEGKGKETKAWRELRRSVADMPRRAEVMRAAGDRHLGALAAVHEAEPLGQAAAKVCQPVVRKGRRHRALNPLDPADAALFAAVNRGEFVLGGLRNRDVRELLYPHGQASLNARQLACRVSRQLARLRAHGLIARLGKSRRYKVTQKGRALLTAFLAAARADTAQLTKLAA